MLGAIDIDLSMLKGHTMLNLDSDEEGHFLTSCAGGMNSISKMFEDILRDILKINFVNVSTVDGISDGKDSNNRF